MPENLWYVLKVSISLAAMYLFYKLLLSRLTFYQWNRWYLLGYALVCFFLPLMNIYGWMEFNSSGQVLRFVPAMQTLTNNAIALPEDQWTQYGVILLVFAVGILVMLARIGIQFYSLHKMHKRARLLTNEGIKLYAVSHPIIPFSFGMSVFIHPEQHDETELKDIIRHEMVHVREHHTIDIIFTEILVALNWFNPFAWLLRQSIRQNLEFIADRQVLEHGLDRKQYQHLLLKVIGQQQFSIASHLNFSALKKRITMMNKIKSAKVHLIKFLFVIPIVAILLLAFRQDQGPQKTTQEMVEPATDTIPPHVQAGYETKVNKKGYILTVADNQGECIVIVKNENKKLVKAVLLTEWNTDDAYEKAYGKIPPPPPPPLAPLAPLPPAFSAGSLAPLAPVTPQATPLPPLPPLAQLPPKATIVAANIQQVSVVNHIATITLKNGKTEQYNFDDAKDKSEFEQKYGTGIKEVAVPSVAPEPTPVPAASKAEASDDETIHIRPSNITSHDNADGTAVTVENQPIYFIEGKEATKKEINAIAPDEIAEMQVFKGTTAIEKYGQKGKNGVILILLKKPKKVSLFNPIAILSMGKDKC